VSRPGALQAEWDHFDLILGLTTELLPVVADTTKQIHPNSKLRAIGKTPSELTEPGSKYVRGMTGWTGRIASASDVQRWRAEPSYSISLQARTIRAFDIDCPDRGEEIAMAIETELGINLPTRMRQGTKKRLLAFRVQGDLAKRVIKTANGAIEFLADGQQFVACGTHTSGVRYAWPGGLPDEFPELSLRQLNAVWERLQGLYGVAPAARTTRGRQATLTKVAKQDPVAQHLIGNDWVISARPDGGLNIRCPNQAAHTSDSGETATTYFLPHTNGFATGQFLCLHAHCQALSHGDFLELCGFTGAQFDVIDLAAPEPAGEAGKVPVVHRPLLLRRRPKGTIIAEIKNIRLSVAHTLPSKATIVVDAFTKGELIGWDAGAWDD
jgi:hypothetical protein